MNDDDNYHRVHYGIYIAYIQGGTCDVPCLRNIYLVGVHPKFIGTIDSSRRGVKVAMRSNTWRIVAPVAD